MNCRRCGGSGELVIKTGKPGHDTHAPYRGVWCVSIGSCPVCNGSGAERDKPPPKPYRGAVKIRSYEGETW